MKTAGSGSGGSAQHIRVAQVFAKLPAGGGGTRAVKEREGGLLLEPPLDDREPEELRRERS